MMSTLSLCRKELATMRNPVECRAFPNVAIISFLLCWIDSFEEFHAFSPSYAMLILS